MSNSQKTTFSLPNDMDIIDDEAESFFKSIIEHYDGTLEHKIIRATEYLDQLIFNLKYDLINPFSNESRKHYKLAVFTRDILIPELIEAIATARVNEQNPLDIHNWN
jgi:hypothetical protein